MHLQVALGVELGGCGRGVLYINTESRFPNKRLVQMTECLISAARRATHPPLAAHRDCCPSASTVEGVLDRIHIAEASDLAALKEILVRCCGCSCQSVRFKQSPPTLQ